MTPRSHGPRIEVQSDLAELADTVALVDEAFASFEAPPGWRVLRAFGQLEAEWREHEHWARFSVRFSSARSTEGALLERNVGRGTVSVVFTCSGLAADTVGAASELLTPLQRVLARAAAH